MRFPWTKKRPCKQCEVLSLGLRIAQSDIHGLQRTVLLLQRRIADNKAYTAYCVEQAVQAAQAKGQGDGADC